MYGAFWGVVNIVLFPTQIIIHFGFVLSQVSLNLTIFFNKLYNI